MNVLISLRDDCVDVQGDTDLMQGRTVFCEGPNRAWLEYTNTNAQGHASAEVAALWLLDTVETASALACVLGVPEPYKGLAGANCWRVTWIVNGQIARRATLSLDRAVFLIQALADQNLLDYETHLFGG